MIANDFDVKYDLIPNSVYCGDNLLILSRFPDNSFDLIYIDPPFFSNETYEIIWKRYPNASVSSKGLSYNTDSIYYYTKSDNYTYNQLYSKEEIVKKFRMIEKETGRRFRDLPLIKKGKTNQTLNFNGKIITLTPNKRFVWSQKRLDDELAKNPYLIYWSKNGVPSAKIYWDEYKGKRLSNLWIDIKGLSPSSKEKLGYPTQKPEALLERIIEMSSNEGDLIGDFYCGCGTSITVAKRLNRKFIGIDVSPLACKIMAERIDYSLNNIIGMKYDVKELKSLDPFYFQKWIVERIGGIMSKRKTGDMGIDGIIPNHRLGSNLPIEVKQHSISRPDVDKFETVLKRTKKKTGFMVAFTFSKGAIEEIARCKSEDGLNIFSVSVKDLS